MTIRGKPNVQAFLDGGNEVVTAPLPTPKKAKLVEAVIEPSKRIRIKKLFELPETMMADLEQRCVDERRQLGRRVTQTEIIERALETYLYSKA